jgi:hypothetical protein
MPAACRPAGHRGRSARRRGWEAGDGLVRANPPDNLWHVAPRLPARSRSSTALATATPPRWRATTASGSFVREPELPGGYAQTTQDDAGLPSPHTARRPDRDTNRDAKRSLLGRNVGRLVARM